MRESLLAGQSYHDLQSETRCKTLRSTSERIRGGHRRGFQGFGNPPIREKQNIELRT